MNRILHLYFLVESVHLRFLLEFLLFPILFLWLLFMNNYLLLSMLFSWKRSLNRFLFLLFLLLNNRLRCNLLRWIIITLYFSTLSINPLENLKHDLFRIKPMNFLKQLSLFVNDSRIGKRSSSDMLHTMLRIPLTIKIVYFKAPLLLNLQSIHYILKVSAVGTVRSKILNKFKDRLVILHLLSEFLFIDEIAIRHIPFFSRC